MKNTKKIIALILALAVIVSTFVACSNNKKENGETTSENSTVVETVTDEQGEAVTDESGETLTEVYEEVPVVDEKGNVVKDKNGETVTKKIPATTNKNNDNTTTSTKPNGGGTTTTKPNGGNTTTTKPTEKPTKPTEKPTKPSTAPPTTEKPTEPPKHKHKFVDRGAIDMDWTYANLDPDYDGPTNTYEKVSAANACINCGYWFGSGKYFEDHYYDHIWGPNASDDCGGAYSLRTIYAHYHLLECSCGANRRGKLAYYDYRMYFNGNDKSPTYFKLKDWQIKEEGLPMP